MEDRRLPERVEGRRLLLRRWAVDDLERMTAAVERNLEHLRPWMPWIADEPLTPEARLGLLHDWETQWRDGGDVAMAIVLGDAIVGSTGLHRRRGLHTLEIGYWVDRDHLGQGIATEAAALLTTAALEVPDISAVEIHHDKANVWSAGVPRRLGYRFVGESPDEVSAPGEVGIDCRWQVDSASWSAAAWP